MNCIRILGPVRILSPSMMCTLAQGQTCKLRIQFSHKQKMNIGVLTTRQSPCVIQRKHKIILCLPVRRIHPVFWIVLKPLAKLTAIITGRELRKRLTYQQKLGIIATLVVVLGLWVVGFYYSHLETSSITGRKRFIAFSHQQFQEILQEEVHQMLTDNSSILPSNHPYYKVVTSVAWKLFNSNRDMKEMSEQKWTVAIIKDSSFNAHVFPTGHIVVNTGLLEFVQNTDQLAVIIGHEMSHALLQHAAEQISAAQLLDMVIILAMTALWAIMPTDGIAVVTQWFMNKVIHIFQTLPYSREMEREADKVGLMLAARACFDVREGAVIWARMGMKENIEGLGEIKLPEWLSTHPSSEKRVELIEHLLPKMYQLRENCRCGPLPARDPRENLPALKYLVDNHITAVKSGQNLVRVQKLTDTRSRR